MNEKEKKLVLFTRYPEPGQTKTRLIPELGEEGAAALQKQMTETVCNTLRPLLDRPGVSVDISFDGGSEEKMTQWLGAQWNFVPQRGGSLGDRMSRAFERAFREGYELPLIIGADCPSLELDHVDGAWNLLRQHDLVLGPAEDGGYYLIGLKVFEKELFRDIDWGTSSVLKETLDRASRCEMSYELLDSLDDIDRPEDLKDF